MKIPNLHDRLAFSAVLAVLVAVMSQSASAQPTMMYWSNEGIIYRANLDGTNKQIVYSQGVTGDHVQFIDVDPVTRRLYLYGNNGATHFVKSTNYDGSGVVTVLANGVPSNKYGFDVDPVNRKMYLGSHGAGAPDGMDWANLDGTDFEAILPDPYYSHDIEADTVHGKLYWTDAVQFNGIRRSNLDGTGQEDVWSGAGTLSNHIALDPANDLIYFADSENEIIGRMNMDGTGVTTLLTGIPAEDIEIDKTTSTLYWTSHTKVQRANTDGTGIEDLVALDITGHAAADSLVLVAVPEPASVFLFTLAGLAALTYRSRPHLT